MHRLFTIVELLERVLLEVDMATLLTAAQRVCRQWHQLISLSPAIQQHLYLIPVPTEYTSRLAHTLHRPHQRNPLLQKHFPCFFEDSFKRDLPIQSNSSLSEYEQELSAHQERFFDLLDNAMPAFRNLPLYRESGVDGPFRREGATWAKMLVCQPPVTQVGLFRFLYRPQTYGEVRTINLRFCGAFEPVAEDGTEAETSLQDSEHDDDSKVEEVAVTSDYLRMADLYDEVVRHCCFGNTHLGFRVLYNVCSAPRESFVYQAGLPFTHTDTRAAEELRRLHDARAEVVVELLKGYTGCGTGERHSMQQNMPFWHKCRHRHVGKRLPRF